MTPLLLGAFPALKALQELSAASPHFRAAADSASVSRASQSASCHSCQLSRAPGRACRALALVPLEEKAPLGFSMQR